MVVEVLLGVFVAWTIREVAKRKRREAQCAAWTREQESAGACAPVGTPPTVAPAAGTTPRQED